MYTTTMRNRYVDDFFSVFNLADGTQSVMRKFHTRVNAFEDVSSY